LHEVYDNLSLIRIWMSSDRTKLPEDQAKLVDLAEELYRSAHRSHKDRDFPHALASALAAADATRGLLDALHASTRPLPSLPAPPSVPGPEAGRSGERAPSPSADRPAPPGTPKEMAREVLKTARERVVASDQATVQGPARSFVDASRAAYELGRQAYEAGDYYRAIDLGSAAEAWARVGDDLKRGEGGKGAPPR
jgi:hypothetical protein